MLNKEISTLSMEHPENEEQYKGLRVETSPTSPGSVNPYLNFRAKRRKPELTADQYVEGILAGDVTILSRAVTLLESTRPEHEQLAQQVIARCLPHAGKSVRIGISGVPGAGKSTSIDEFGLHVLERTGGKLAVLAIDPTSERTGGSILGDKTRMEKLSVHPKSFIRPSPSGGSLGGVARKTRETIVLCEAAGYNTIFVETVGVGQSETACHSMVDFFLVLQVTGTGDELQGIKRGIMEMADGIALNKCDGDNVERCKLAAAYYKNALHLFPTPPSGWTTQVYMYSGLFGYGIKELWDSIYEYIDFVKHNGYFEERRNNQNLYWLHETIEQAIHSRFYNDSRVITALQQAEDDVRAARQTSFRAAENVLNTYFGPNSVR
jgi:LAO/AO transport system kinase